MLILKSISLPAVPITLDNAPSLFNYYLVSVEGLVLCKTNRRLNPCLIRPPILCPSIYLSSQCWLRLLSRSHSTVLQHPRVFCFHFLSPNGNCMLLAGAEKKNTPPPHNSYIVLQEDTSWPWKIWVRWSGLPCALLLSISRQTEGAHRAHLDGCVVSTV